MSAAAQPARSQWAKFTAPASPRWLPRRRLFELLDSRLRESRALWVSAAGGSGKTSLVASYLQSRKSTTLWYQFDTTDSDPASLFSHLRRMAESYELPVAGRLPSLTPEYLAALPVFARNFFRTLYDALPSPGTLVLDNIQDAAAECGLDELIPLMLEEAPAGLRVICVSRHAPPSSLARMRAHGELATLGWDQLRLQHEETRALAAKLMDRPLSEAFARDILARTDGWMIGVLQLLSRAAQGQEDLPAEDLPQGRLLFDYFAAEVLNGLSSAQRDVLLSLSVLGSTDLDLAQRLTGDSNVGALLRELVRKNQFVFIRQTQTAQPSYDLHPLFHAFLLAQAHKQWRGPRWDELRHKAAALLEDVGRSKEAVSLLVELEAWPELGRLILSHALDLVREGRHLLLKRWLEAMPAAALDVEPWLQFWLGVATEPSDLVRARSIYEPVLHAFKKRGDAAGAYSAWAAYAGTYSSLWAGFSQLDTWLEGFAELRAQFPQIPTPEVRTRVICGMVNALLWRQPEHPDFETWAAEARDLVRHSDDPDIVALTAHLLLVRELWWRGDTHEAERLVEEVRIKLRGRSVSPLIQVVFESMEAALFGRINRPAECLRAARDGLEIAERFGVYVLNGSLTLEGVHGSLVAGDWDTAARDLAASQPHLAPESQLDIAHFHIIGAWTGICGGDFHEAAHHAKRALEYGERCGAALTPPWAHFTSAQIAIEHKDHDDAVAHLDHAQAWAERADSQVLRHQCLLSRAHAHLEVGDESQSLAALRAALELGQRLSYSPYPWMMGWRRDVMAKLCAEALAHDIEPEYVRDLIRKQGLVAGPDAVGLEAWPFPVRISTLGRFSVAVAGQTCAAGKTQRKPWELLQATVALGGRVASAQLAEVVWPDADGDSAQRSLHTTVHRLRKLLATDGAVQLGQGLVSVDAGTCWVDVWALERLLDEIRAANGVSAAGLARRLIALYPGHFLANETDSPWAVAMRERLRGRFKRGLMRLGARLVTAGQVEAAVGLFEHGAELDPTAESLHRALIACYALCGRRPDALSAFLRLRTSLARVLGVTPSAQTEALEAAIRGGVDDSVLLRQHAFGNEI